MRRRWPQPCATLAIGFITCRGENHHGLNGTTSITSNSLEATGLKPFTEACPAPWGGGEPKRPSVPLDETPAAKTPFRLFGAARSNRCRLTGSSRHHRHSSPRDEPLTGMAWRSSSSLCDQRDIPEADVVRSGVLGLAWAIDCVRYPELIRPCPVCRDRRKDWAT